ncbi:MAG: hypothetical protein ACRDRY_24735, partial [Pseudonocardiaceae bacterium]
MVAPTGGLLRRRRWAQYSDRRGRPSPADLRGEAFRWTQWRTVTKTATVSLHGNLYEVDPALPGARVE